MKEKVFDPSLPYYTVEYGENHKDYYNTLEEAMFRCHELERKFTCYLSGFGIPYHRVESIL